MRLSITTILLSLPLLLFSQTGIPAGEYWFDNDRSAVQQVMLSGSTAVSFASDIDISGLNDGLHTFHIRFADDNGSWSGVLSRFFIKDDRAAPSEIVMVSALQYWFDSDYSNAVTSDIEDASSLSFSSDLSVSALEDGLHTVHLRFAGSDGKWSGIISRFFVMRKTEPATVNRELERLEYWFDNDLSSLVATSTVGDQLSISEFIDLSGMPDGLHTIGLRAVDGQGTGSSAITRFFVKRRLYEEVSSSITGYRYWVNDTMVVTRMLDDRSPSVITIDSLDLRLYPGGEYTVNFQFRDSQGLWSGAVHDTIIKISYPYALMDASPAAVCAGDSILFTALVVDTDSLLWDFGDGLTADSASTWHTYTEGGEYLVSISVSDTSQDITTQIVYPDQAEVFSLPVIELGDPLTITEDESVILDAGSGFASYLWNDIGGASMYTVSGGTLGTGVHLVWATIEDDNGCAATDTIEVTVTVANGVGVTVEETIRVYPNPAGDYLRIDWKNHELEDPEITLIDGSGRMLISSQPIYNGGEMDLSRIRPGRYILIIKAGDEVIRVPIIKIYQ